MANDIAREIEAMEHMTTSELAERYRELHGEPVRTRHRTYLIRKIAWRIQANAGGDLTERARRRAAGAGTVPRDRSPRRSPVHGEDESTAAREGPAPCPPACGWRLVRAAAGGCSPNPGWVVRPSVFATP